MRVSEGSWDRRQGRYGMRVQEEHRWGLPGLLKASFLPWAARVLVRDFLCFDWSSACSFTEITVSWVLDISAPRERESFSRIRSRAWFAAFFQPPSHDTPVFPFPSSSRSIIWQNTYLDLGGIRISLLQRQLPQQHISPGTVAFTHQVWVPGRKGH